MKKTTKLVAAGALAAALVAGTAISASAVSGGWRDCPTGQVVTLASDSTGWTNQKANGAVVYSKNQASRYWAYTKTAPSINNFDITGSPLYGWTTYCQA